MSMDTPIVPTDRDVINGRGQGLQRIPGNVRYRKLVAANKELYAQCPNGSKIEVSKAIVAAIRNFQGRFLDTDIDTDPSKKIYYDIGDKRAIEKTSQCLREGQGKIRKLLHNKSGKETPLTKEAYFAFSLKVLGELYDSDTSSNSNMNPGMLLSSVMQLQLPSLPSPKLPRHKQTSMPPLPPPLETDINNITPPEIKMALDQFPMARQVSPEQWKKETVDSGSNESVSMARLSTISAIHTISSGMSSEASRAKANRKSFDTIVTSRSHQKILEEEKHYYDLDFIDEATAFDEASGMSFKALPEEPLEPINTISSGVSSEASRAKANRKSFDTIVTSRSHQKILEEEKHYYDLDFIDEATVFDEASGMSFTALPEEPLEPIKESQNVPGSDVSMMDQSDGNFSISVTSDADDMFNHLLGMSNDDELFRSGTSVEV